MIIVAKPKSLPWPGTTEREFFHYMREIGFQIDAHQTFHVEELAMRAQVPADMVERVLQELARQASEAHAQALIREQQQEREELFQD